MERQQSIVLVRLERFGRYLENSLLCLLLGLMLAIGAMQIIQRNFFSTSFIWTDESLRLLVLWLSLVGAVTASRDDKHITIDILSRFLTGKKRLFLLLVLDLFTVSVCSLLAWYGGSFVRMELEFSSKVLSDLPAWIFESVIPIAFGLIAYRYAIFFCKNLCKLRDLWRQE
ncbi:MAG: TRAP transporter small permease [Desulfuromonas sp.]|nr:MAG: TRAP transporter small permease [Desulfuromonas sp.]